MKKNQISPNTEKVAKQLKTKFSKSSLSKVIGGGWLSNDSTNTNTQTEDTKLSPAPIAGQTVSKLQTDEYTKLSEGGSSRLSRGDGAADIVAKTINFMIKAHAKKMELREIENDFKKTLHEKDEHEHIGSMHELGIDVPKSKIVHKKITEPKNEKVGPHKHREPTNFINKAINAINEYGPAVGVVAGTVLSTYDKAMAKVGKAESGGDYNQMNIPGKDEAKNSKVVAGKIDVTTKEKFSKNLTDMTIPEVIALSNRRGEKFKKLNEKTNTIDKSAGKAAGKYQFMPTTLQEYSKKLWPTTWETMKFDAPTQEALKQEYEKNIVSGIKKHTKLPITEQLIRFTHMVGPNSESIDKFAKATDTEKMANIMSESAKHANQDVAKLTVGAYRASLLKKYELTNLPIVEESTTSKSVIFIDNSNNNNSSVVKKNVNVTQKPQVSDLPNIIKK